MSMARINKRIVFPAFVMFGLTLIGIFGTWLISRYCTRQESMLCLNVYVPMSSSENSWDRISNEISKITVQKIGCKVKLQGIALDSYYDDIMQNYLNGKQMDICAVFGQASFLSMVNNEILCPIEEAIKPYSIELQDILWDEAWKSCFVRGHQYGLPSNYGNSQSIGLVMRRDICEALNISPEEIEDFNDVHEVLLKVKHNYPDLAPLGAHYGQTIPFLGIDTLGNGLGVIIDFENDPPEIVNLYESGLYEDYCNMMHQWYEEGLILDQCYNRPMSFGQLMIENEIFACFNNAGKGVTNMTIVQGDISLVEVRIGSALISTDSTNLYWGITNNSIDVQMAMELLYMMYTDSDIIKLYTWGMEGVDYEVSELGEPIWLNNGDRQWQSIPWSWPNARLLEPLYKESAVERYIVNDKVIRSPACGFLFDSEAVSDEVVLCQAVVEKYDLALLSGYLDPQEVLPDFIKELESAGIYSVIREKERQFKLWMEQ